VYDMTAEKTTGKKKKGSSYQTISATHRVRSASDYQIWNSDVTNRPLLLYDWRILLSFCRQQIWSHI